MIFCSLVYTGSFKMKKLKIAIGITGASGSVYAQTLLMKLAELSSAIERCDVVISEQGKNVWKHELGSNDFKKEGFRYFDVQDFNAPFASGSAGYDALIICPCSMGTLGRIASGVSNDLITRAADVMLKERKKLIVLLRESPYNLIHINNMKTVTEAGGIIVPASPSFYHKPESIEALITPLVERILIMAGLDIETYSWQGR